ncbi:hypothetical protein [Nesterenkonia natronophila]|uniref:Uncharacterized protein n=1 Tax=Nesterenkonia natronophila TaxID=2174932 RepID=A0A3A4FC25_9MICC|nr:hypothetical protein [Nesterenkonia natronophila]RJN32657.1 hypothetical protein D3250_02165 [Nesterenkonia natronophila]
MTVLPRTAVVVVHGIGEQKPLDTLRGFVGKDDGSETRGESGIIRKDDFEHSYIGPDRFTGRTYSRRIVLDHTHRLLGTAGLDSVESRRYNRLTEFYEYYWAYRFRDTAWHHLPGFLLRLLRARRKDLPDGAMKGGTGPRTTLIRWGVAGISLVIFAASTFIAYGVTPGASRNLLPWSAAWHPWVLGAVVMALFLLTYCAMSWALKCGLITTARSVAVVPIAILTGASSGPVIARVGFDQDEPWVLVSCILAFPTIAIAAILWLVCRPKAKLLVLVGVVAVVGAGLIVFAVSQTPGGLDSIVQPARSILVGVWAVVPLIFGGFALYTLGDAARYFSNSPSDVVEREHVRSGLMDLLRALEERRDPVTGRHVYERVVVVGHSLGSVIAYDALTSLWAEVNQSIDFPATEDEADPAELWTVVANLEGAQYNEYTEADGPNGAESLDGNGLFRNAPGLRKRWRDDQRSLQAALRAEERISGNTTSRVPARWIVSDLITVGSPLAHAEVLLADSTAGLLTARKYRLLPINPPARQWNSEAEEKNPYRYLAWRGPSYSTRLHHGALFAATSWTNLYFEHDLIGGPLSQRLGGAIEDIELQGAKAGLWGLIRANPHSSYWRAKNDKNARGSLESRQQMAEIIIQESPVFLVTGKPSQLGAFRAKLVANLDAFTRDVPASTEFFELRVLRQTAEGSPTRAWTWLALDPWLPLPALSQVAEIALKLRLRVTFSDGASPSRGDASAESQVTPEPSNGVERSDDGTAPEFTDIFIEPAEQPTI